MIQTFRETEVPLRDMEMRRRYKHQLTESNAITRVCEVIADSLSSKDTMPVDVASLLKD